MAREQKKRAKLLGFEDMFYMGKLITVILTRVESEEIDTGIWRTRYFVERNAECMDSMLIEVTPNIGEAREAFEIFVNDMRAREELYQSKKTEQR